MRRRVSRDDAIVNQSGSQFADCKRHWLRIAASRQEEVAGATVTTLRVIMLLVIVTFTVHMGLRSRRVGKFISGTGSVMVVDIRESRRRKTKGEQRNNKRAYH